MKMKKLNEEWNNKGFSLVELIIVIAIIAILIAVLVPNFIKYVDKANKASDVQTANTVGEALERIIATDPKAAQQWRDVPTYASNIHFVVRDYTGETYTLNNVFEYAMLKKGNGTSYGDIRNAVDTNLNPNGKVTYLCNLLNEEVMTMGITMHFRRESTDLMRICRRQSDGRVEIWIGGDGEGRNSNIYYRLYPDPDPRYYTDDYSNRPIYGGRRKDGSTNIEERP